MKVGFDRTDGGGYVTAYNYNWGGIEDDEWYPLLFALDGQDYDAEGRGVYFDDLPGVHIPFDNPDFLFDIAKKYTMTLYNTEGEVMAIDLTGSYKALEAALECQDEMG